MTPLEALLIAGPAILGYALMDRVMAHFLPRTAMSLHAQAIRRAAARIARTQGYRRVRPKHVDLDVNARISKRYWHAGEPETKNRENAPTAHDEDT